jgi:uncharacterized low-complexity protein
MKRIATVVALAFAALSLGAVAPAQAASACLTYDVSINGQGQAGTICLPPA